jgi:hypothetical protein
LERQQADDGAIAQVVNLTLGEVKLSQCGVPQDRFYSSGKESSPSIIFSVLGWARPKLAWAMAIARLIDFLDSQIFHKNNH